MKMILINRDKIVEAFQALAKVVCYGNQEDVKNICNATALIMRLLMDNPIDTIPKADGIHPFTEEDRDFFRKLREGE